MLRRAVLLLQPAVAVAGLALGCAFAADVPERDFVLAPGEWQRVAALLDWPRAGLPVREVRAVRAYEAGVPLLQVEVASAFTEQADGYRRWWRSHCSNGSGAWRCEPGEEVVEPPRGGAVVLGPHASPRDVVLLAHLLGHRPGQAGARELLSVRAAGTHYHVSWRLGRCEHAIKLLREGDRFLRHPWEQEVTACM